MSEEILDGLIAGITDGNRHEEIPVSVLAPEGWQLVPKEPTKEMIQACIWALDRWREKHGNVQGFVPPGDKYQVRWRAMLEAAPAPPEEVGGQR